uniref:Rho-GAP domain-containing protein n=1 Tax=Seriola lalandi dorsalis TaxID=1841481 RepID=A0A3B4WRJ2_SERLL
MKTSCTSNLCSVRASVMWPPCVLCFRESFLVPVCPETCPLVQSFLGSSDRSFLLHGHAQLKTGMQTQDRHLFLFTDILVIAKAKSANHFKQKAQVCVCEMWTAGCMDEVCEGSTNPDRSFVMGWPTSNCVATFSSTEQKERWLSTLRRKECDVARGSECLLINVIQQLFHAVSSSVSGHEFPFSIQMSHVRHNTSQGGGGGGAGGRDAAAPPADRQKAMQVEQLQVYKHCQFILKPRPKPFKRRRSLITWAFWRGSSSHLNELSLASAPRGCLFARPLSSVCVEDALPKPVMDMLAFLYHEGSWTRGIFRRPAGARAVRELRDSLDAGVFQLPLTREHVFIIAGVFKDFLRSIPGSLLCCELYEEWMDVLEEEEEEKEQVQDIQRMTCRLPKENALLLRYLLAVLHGIRGNAHENQMTSFNLSVCIAPSMLWPPGAPCSPEVEGEGAKKVCELVKFMIEHCQQILGEDPSSLFGGPPQRRSDDEMGSDWIYPLTDSSYDSLENELDNSSGGSPGFCSRDRLRAKLLQGSLDSILTFSDYDQDTDAETRRSQTDNLHGLNLHPLERTRGKRQDPDLSSPSPASPTADTSTTLDSLCLDGLRRQRRRSEPAIAYMAKFRPCVLGSTDGLTGEDEDGGEELSKKPSSHTLARTHSRGQTRRGGSESGSKLYGGRSAALEASSSSLSSTPTSPAPTRSSLDSDSISSDHTCATRRGLVLPKTHLASNSTSALSASFTISSALTSSGSPDLGTTTKDSPPKEPLNWGTLKGCRGLHPNSWLKKGRRLSLTQQDNLEKEEEDKTGVSKVVT